jgi:hypothetical protein
LLAFEPPPQPDIILANFGESRGTGKL